MKFDADCVVILFLLFTICSVIYTLDSYSRFQVVQNNQKEVVINAQWAKSVEYCADAAASVFGK